MSPLWRNERRQRASIPHATGFDDAVDAPSSIKLIVVCHVQLRGDRRPVWPVDTLAGDVATIKRTLGRVSSPAILVGHSYDGSVITPAESDDWIAGLVYIAALAPDADETS